MTRRPRPGFHLAMGITHITLACACCAVSVFAALNSVWWVVPINILLALCGAVGAAFSFRQSQRAI